MSLGTSIPKIRGVTPEIRGDYGIFFCIAVAIDIVVAIDIAVNN